MKTTDLSLIYKSLISYIKITSVTLVLLLTACTKAPRWSDVPKGTTPIMEGNSVTATTATPWKKRPAGQVAPGHMVTIKSSDPRVNGDFRIEFDNSLKLPYNVRLTTTGLNEDQLRSAIRNSYRKYFRSPNDIQVSVAQKEYLIDVEGLVQKPGQYLVKQNTSLDEIIAFAGGLKEGGQNNNVARYVRINGISGQRLIGLGDYYSGSGDLTPQWQGGETVFFQSEGGGPRASARLQRNFVNVIGQVRNPAEYPAETNANFYTYLIKAGGPTDRADLSRVTLLRSHDSQMRAITFNMLDPREIPEVLPGDSIIFNGDSPTPLERDSGIAASFANVISAIGIIVIAALA